MRPADRSKRLAGGTLLSSPVNRAHESSGPAVDVDEHVETASGQVSAWIIILPSVSVGGIRVESVQASVVEGDFPATVLLGMTFLRHVKLQEDSGVLSLSRDW